MSSSKSSTSSLSKNDRILLWCLRGHACLAGIIVALIGSFLVMESAGILADIGFMRFFTDATWSPTTGSFNLMPMIVGTLLVSGAAVAIAAPLGLLLGIFCHFYAPSWLRSPVRRMIELLGGIPSVVYGFWGLVVLVPLITAWRPPGASLLAASLVLALMILPTIALMTDAAIAAVPRQLPQSAYAMGLGHYGALRAAVIPSASSGLLTGVLLGTGRAIGETMAVIMVCGNIVQVPSTIFDPVRTLTANIALEMAYAMGSHRSALFVSGLVLLVMVVILVALIEAIRKEPNHG